MVAPVRGFETLYPVPFLEGSVPQKSQGGSHCRRQAYLGLHNVRTVAVHARLLGLTIAHRYKQVYWIYAFRFLKAAFYVQGGSQADAHALENLRSITILAGERGDNAICVLGYLLEGLTLLKTMKDDAIVRIQTCIAQASKYQLYDTVHIPQLDILTLLLDLACSLHQKVPSDVMKKLTALQSRMDDLVHVPSWKEHTTELLLPMRKQGTSSQTISGDTGDILRPGDGDCDFLVLSSFSKMEVYVLA